MFCPLCSGVDYYSTYDSEIVFYPSQEVQLILKAFRKFDLRAFNFYYVCIVRR